MERRDVGPHDVLIEIKYSGICHSDIHNARSDWGPSAYPLVPGHEIAGIVAQVGSEVTRYAVGDRVGVGCMVDSCRECANCLKGEEQYCLKGNTLTYGSVDKDGTLTQGGYSTHVVVTDGFVLRQGADQGPGAFGQPDVLGGVGVGEAEFAQHPIAGSEGTSGVHQRQRESCCPETRPVRGGRDPQAVLEGPAHGFR
ncbi:hypothetical protein FCI23_50760 [Actinacidiphila oryziradicis]|uniref:alcohol dehydrogenase (NADP(+)) n=1 Tax=Actinacidiphila oryziradicis TaxID=2571141 RepID=A0A4U0S819_9ACTN|nr:hypothetical protein FCI23_50760 [Actinacidiphila oryziradicis]